MNTITRRSFNSLLACVVPFTFLNGNSEHEKLKEKPVIEVDISKNKSRLSDGQYPMISVWLFYDGELHDLNTEYIADTVRNMVDDIMDNFVTKGDSKYGIVLNYRITERKYRREKWMVYRRELENGIRSGMDSFLDSLTLHIRTHNITEMI